MKQEYRKGITAKLAATTFSWNQFHIGAPFPLPPGRVHRIVVSISEYEPSIDWAGSSI